MALPRNSRQGSQGPSATLIITGSAVIGFLLIAVWVLSAPAAIPEGGTSLSTDRNTKSSEGVFTTPETNSENSPTEDESDVNKPPVIEDPEPSSTTETSTTAVDEPETSPIEERSKPTPFVAESEPTSPEEKKATEEGDGNLPDDITSGTEAELTTETQVPNTTSFGTQDQESKDEKSVQERDDKTESTTPSESTPALKEIVSGEIPEWKLCNFDGAQDYIPCLDNKKAIKQLPTTAHYEHRERHCPSEEELPKCLLPLPLNYKVPIKWPESRDAVWFSNVPHTELASYKSDQNWVKLSDNKQKLIFPGGGTQFKTEHGAAHYIEYIQKIVPEISWGKHIRTLLDVGCGVASFGGYLFDKDVLAMSLAPKDEHEAQIQFALERGIPAINSVMGTQRLVFPSLVFDVVHCARCRVPWEKEGGMLMLELNRLLRPGGFFVWSATPVYWDLEEDVQIWKDVSDLLKRMQWKMITRSIDPDTKVGVAIFQKPVDNALYDSREDTTPPMCDDSDNPDAAWYVPMKACMHKIPAGEGSRAASWPAEWPLRVDSTPAWLSSTEKGIYGKPQTEDFETDSKHWKRVVGKSYIGGLGIDWNSIRKVMDMKAGYGGLAAALVSYPLWVMNIIPVTEPDTLPIIFDRGLIGMYHDWCEPHSTYPRSYDLMHSDRLLSTLPDRCKTVNVLMEMDRILRPDGWAIFRDTAEVITKVEVIVKSLHWDIILNSSEEGSTLLVAQKKFWRPDSTL